MICESQLRCKNCQNELKCYAGCNRFIYDQNDDAEDNFELEKED